MYTIPFVQSKCSCFNFGLIWGLSPGLWKSARKPSRKIFVGIAGEVDEEASGVSVVVVDLVAFAGLEAFDAADAASARALAAASFEPKSSVKIVSKEDLT